ncbi:SCO3374 family protein [Streptomyces sp. DSM 40484]|uniref:SCO3374 family protein n=1 Tax=Streptomyces kroppenstedtii TaxID=3051181 RepID=UPI0028D33DC8|nr:SCO3374 family protein [Streptomyces sp. DSM 40484]
MVSTVPFPRRPPDAVRPDDTVRHWYENELGWATVPGAPVGLLTGLRFDVLEAPAEAGYAALRHLGPGSPVAVRGDRMRLFVAAGSAEELPGLLDWLEWGSLKLDLTATGAGGRVEAPLPPGPARGAHEGPGEAGGGGAGGCAGDNARGAAGPGGAERGRVTGSQGAAVWLRPPEPGCEVESSLPTLSALGGGGGGAPDLVRLVETMASECHRIRLRHGCAQPLAFS